MVMEYNRNLYLASHLDCHFMYMGHQVKRMQRKVEWEWLIEDMRRYRKKLSYETFDGKILKKISNQKKNFPQIFSEPFPH